MAPPRLYAEANEKGLRAIVGSELTLEDGCVLPVLVQKPDWLSKTCGRMITRAPIAVHRKAKAGFYWSELEGISPGSRGPDGRQRGPLFTTPFFRQQRKPGRDRSPKKIIQAFGRDQVLRRASAPPCPG